MWEPGIYEWMKEKKKEGKGRNEVEGILELFFKIGVSQWSNLFNHYRSIVIGQSIQFEKIV